MAEGSGEGNGIYDAKDNEVHFQQAQNPLTAILSLLQSKGVPPTAENVKRAQAMAPQQAQPAPDPAPLVATPQAPQADPGLPVPPIPQQNQLAHRVGPEQPQVSPQQVEAGGGAVQPAASGAGDVADRGEPDKGNAGLITAILGGGGLAALLSHLYGRGNGPVGGPSAAPSGMPGSPASPEPLRGEVIPPDVRGGLPANRGPQIDGQVAQETDPMQLAMQKALGVDPIGYERGKLPMPNPQAAIPAPPPGSLSGVNPMQPNTGAGRAKGPQLDINTHNAPGAPPTAIPAPQGPTIRMPDETPRPTIRLPDNSPEMAAAIVRKVAALKGLMRF